MLFDNYEWQTLTNCSSVFQITTIITKKTQLLITDCLEVTDRKDYKLGFGNSRDPASLPK